MDPSLAESMGIDIENLIVSRPNTAENLLSAVDTLAKSGSVDVIVVDSVSYIFLFWFLFVEKFICECRLAVSKW